jgi:two-component system phosphate regulon sensor histidine kinase PhoR
LRFRHKLLLFGLGVAALAATAVLLAGGAVIRASVGERVSERLEREAVVLADWLALDPALLPDPLAGVPARGAGAAATREHQSAEKTLESSRRDAPEPANRCDEFADRMGDHLGLRVTVVALDGAVLGDSARDGEALAAEDNHSGRPEIVEAGRSGQGSASRRSATVAERLLYVARRVDRSNRAVGFVRLAMPIPEIERVSGRYSQTLALVSFVLLLGVVAVGYAAARRFSRPIEAMSLAADAIAAGRRDLSVPYGSGDELGRLGAALNRMTRALSDQILELSQEKRLRDTILGGMKEGLLVVDQDGRVLHCNQALRFLLGSGGRDPAGRPLIELTRDRGVIESFDAALGGGEEVREIIRPDGGTSGQTFEITVSPLMGPDGAQIGALGLFVDLTRLSALEGVRREFIADVSHELRSPLTSIKAFVETLLAGGLEDTEHNRRFLEIVQKHSNRMEAILDDLTDLSLIETGSITLEIAGIDLASLTSEVIESLRPRAEARGVGLVSRVPPGTVLPADRGRLEQILVNLLDNAIKFNRTGGTVTVRVEAATGEAESLRVVVEDTGIGIPPEALGKIFHRFYRVDRARSREAGGTGLGLSIVRHLMRLHGGGVKAESEVGRGSRFILEFPAAPAGSR